ncbi:hypothetical protein AB0M43_37710 [Longispora sp. NPDC051575]|uniref:hypothetical protein n=1 Tax=Longispora sp. NPDC051575 TaxID=3154943 RepID=UPI00341D6E50
MSRLARLIAVTLLGLAVLLCSSSASADPTPTPSPSPTSDKPDCTGVPIAALHNEFIWCVTWANNDEDVTVTCDRARDAADRAICTAVTQSLQPDPKAKEKSVLGGRDGKVHCEHWDVLINAPDTAPLLKAQATQRRSACQGARGYLEARADKSGSTLPAECLSSDPRDIPVCQVKKALGETLGSAVAWGMQGLVVMAVQAAQFLLGRMAITVFASTSMSPPGDSFFISYNSITGPVIYMIFIFFVISTVISALRTNGPGPLATLGGVVRAVLGVFCAGGIAWLIEAAWTDVTINTIKSRDMTKCDAGIWMKSFSTLASGPTAFIAFLLALLAIVALFLLFIVLFFRSMLVEVSALFGAVVMAGQVMPETRNWARKWLWTVNALAMSQWVIAELWMYGACSAVNSDNLITCLKGVALLWCMALCPWIFLRVMSMWDAHLADVNARGLLSAAASAAGIGNLLEHGARALSNLGSGNNSSGPSESSDPLASADAEIPTDPVTAAGESAGDDSGEDPDAQGQGNQDDPSAQAARSLDQGGDGQKVGEAAPTPGEQDTEQGGQEGPGAQEAGGLEEGQRTAQDNLASGEVTPPGESDGSAGSAPITPEAASSEVTGSGGGDSSPDSAGTSPGGDSASSPPGAPDAAGPGPAPGASGADGGAGGEPDGGSASSGPAPDGGGGESGKGGSGSGGQQAGKAEAAASEIPPIV